MCDCCDEYYCGGCGSSDQMLGESAALLAVTPYVKVVEDHSEGVTDNTLVTLAEAKQHCRVDIDDDDALIQLYLNAAGDYITERTGVPTRSRGWRVYYDAFPTGSDPIVPPYVGLDTTKIPETVIQYSTTSSTTESLGIMRFAG